MGFIGAIAQAGASVYGAAKQASAQNKATRANQISNTMNLEARNQERLDAIKQAEFMQAFLGKTYEDQKNERGEAIKLTADQRKQFEAELGKYQKETNQGYTDALGNRTYFDPEKGWVTYAGAGTEESRRARSQSQEDDKDFRSLRDEQIGMGRETMQYARDMRKRATDTYDRDAAFSDRQQQEVVRGIEQERPLVTEQLKQNFRQQGKERDVASGLMDAFLSLQQEDPLAYESLLRKRSTDAINEAYDATESNVLRTAMRTNSNDPKVAAELARSRSKEQDKASLNAMIEARGVTKKEYQDERNALGSLYGAFAARSSAIPKLQEFTPVDGRSPDMRLVGTPDINLIQRGAFGNQLEDPAAIASTTVTGARNLRSGFQSTPFTQMPGSVQPNLSGQSALVNAFGAKGGTMDYQQANTGDAMMWSSIGSSLGNLGQAWDLESRRRGNNTYGSSRPPGESSNPFTNSGPLDWSSSYGGTGGGNSNSGNESLF